MKFRISNFTTSDGTEISVPESGIVLFVGPNNAGKSQALKDIIGLARNGPAYAGKTITAMISIKDGDQANALDWASTHLPLVTRDGFTRTMVQGWGEVQPTDFAQQWAGSGQSLSLLTETLMLYADGTTRLTSGNSEPSFDVRNSHPATPIQRAYSDPELENAFSDASKTAFGLELVVDRYAGSTISLRLGKRPEFTHTSGIPSRSYLDSLSALPSLEDQGDGVKSFMGLMIQLIAGSHQSVLIDEPEAFLHPPQARLLGRLLAKRATEQQVFLATHSAAIVQGVLEAGTPVTIVRLTRENAVNRAAVLADDALQELWADPVLRYSSILEGLFYDAVVLCESDSDSRFYAATRDHLIPEPVGAERRLELLFAQSGGKARIAVIVRALQAVRVPVVAVADFDVLRVEADVLKTVEALGGDFAPFAADRTLLGKALDTEGKPLRKTSAREALLATLDAMNEVLSKEDVEALRSILKAETGWDKAKRGGKGVVPQGDPSAAADRLLTGLREVGLLVVPVGELERFVPGVGGHGPAWVNEVLAQGLHLSPAAEAQSFVQAIEQLARERSGRPPSSTVEPTEVSGPGSSR